MAPRLARPCEPTWLRNPSSRRAFLRVSGLTIAGGGLALAGCGGGDERPGAKAYVPPTPTETDLKLLNSALDLENTAIAAYTAGLPLLEGTALAAARQFLAHEREHARALTEAIRDLGGRATTPRSDEYYAEAFPILRSPLDVLRFAVDLENMAVKAYVDAIPELSEPELRQAGAAIVSSEAEHIAVLLGELDPGDPTAQVPETFVTGVASA